MVFGARAGSSILLFILIKFLFFKECTGRPLFDSTQIQRAGRRRCTVASFSFSIVLQFFWYLIKHEDIKNYFICVGGPVRIFPPSQALALGASDHKRKLDPKIPVICQYLLTYFSRTFDSHYSLWLNVNEPVSDGLIPSVSVLRVTRQNPKGVIL